MNQHIHFVLFPVVFCLLNVAYSVLACGGYQRQYIHINLRKLIPTKSSHDVNCHFNKQITINNVPVHVGGIITVSLSFRRLYLIIASPLSSLSSSMQCMGSGTSCFSSSSSNLGSALGVVVRVW